MKRLLRIVRKALSLALCFTFLFSQSGFAQVAAQLNLSGHLGHALRPADKFRPVCLRYFSYEPLNNEFKLLLDKGDFKKLDLPQAKESAKDLLKYFLIGVTLPDASFWVNLRPDSPDRIIDDTLAKTDIGRIFLESDVQLKKDLAQFTSPQSAEGKIYWNKLYKKAGELFSAEGGSAYGGGNITIPTLTRPWIVPGEIIVRQASGSAYVYKATLKVMLEEDYLKAEGLGNSAFRLNTGYSFNDPRQKALNEYSAQLIRELIIPKLTKEVNSSKRYASLRQVYYSLILARWFKANFQGKEGVYSSLIDQRNLNGLTSAQPWSKTTYFNEYKKSFEKGEYNIKEPVSGIGGQAIRSYVSGGIGLAQTPIAGLEARHSNWAVESALGFSEDIICLGGGAGTASSPVPGELKEANLGGSSSSPVVPSPLLTFQKIEQQIWLDGLTYEMLLNGGFEALVRDHGISGVTTNPPLIKAYLADERVRAKLAELAREGLSQDQIYFELIKDLALAVISTYKKYNVEGKFSVEIDPTKAEDVDASVAEAIKWTDIDPEYMMVKVPVSQAGYQIIEDIIAEGRNVNVTLIFSPGQYWRAAEAYIKGLHRALQAGHDLIRIYSVASFFISRWDIKFAKQIPLEYHGMFANSIAIDSYNRIFRVFFESEGFKLLQEKGARVQDFLLASTGSKASDPNIPDIARKRYPEDVYVSNTQGPHVVNTLPIKTIDFLKTKEDIRPDKTIISNNPLAQEILKAMDVDLEAAGLELFQNGLKSFQKDFNEIRATISGIVSAAVVSSSPLSTQDDSRFPGAGALGGIDFAAMNINVQRIGSFSGVTFSPPARNMLDKLDLNEESKQIKLMLDRDILPAAQRVKEFAYASYFKNGLSVRPGDLVPLLVRYCRLEEESGRESDAALKESLMLMDARLSTYEVEE